MEYYAHEVWVFAILGTRQKRNGTPRPVFECSLSVHLTEGDLLDLREVA